MPDPKLEEALRIVAAAVTEVAIKNVAIRGRTAGFITFFIDDAGGCQLEAHLDAFNKGGKEATMLSVIKQEQDVKVYMDLSLEEAAAVLSGEKAAEWYYLDEIGGEQS